MCTDLIIPSSHTHPCTYLLHTMHTQSNSNTTVNSILLSIQLFGVPNLSSALLDYPVKLFFTPLNVSYA